ncbi:PEP/pyruvate-binding domain-containing protein [Nonomuraea gerenzanensis]|nr:PEP/pyruvate-binding domain-containing protein [Nonomuraea gerenzanensis]UBU16308.1 pyruvate, phosphate dikinase [Nonomuraea gerenzanensis]
MEAVGGTCGGKAGALGVLLRAGLPVPDGFVVPFGVYRGAVRELGLERIGGEPDGAEVARRAIEARPPDAGLLDALGRGLGALGCGAGELSDFPVAVRSSAADEDTGQASAAGRYESFLAVRGVGAVAQAVRACWASLFSPRAVGGSAMAVIVQLQVDAEVSGVMFTPAGPGDVTRIEASWGLGPSVVGGTVTPDSYRVAADGSLTRTVADKRIRLDRRGERLVLSDVPAGSRDRPAIDDATALRLAGLGEEVAALLGGPQDIEWAIAGGHVWLLQARPITVAPPPPSHTSATAAALPQPSFAPDVPAALTGTPGSHGRVTGTVRIVRGPRDFPRVRPGDILVCPFTDPAWTPLLRIAGGVVTEVGGVLSHAAIVAREHAIPAVLGIRDATSRLHDDTLITIDGTTGTITVTDHPISEGAGSGPS